MNKLLIFSLLLGFHLSCKSQQVLRNNVNISQSLVIRDTLQYTHSKYTKIDYGIIIKEYRLSNYDYNNYHSFKLNDLGYSIEQDSILDRYDPIEFELVPDFYDGYMKVYDPHNLFSIRIKDEYVFSFPKLSYSVRKDDLVHGIKLKELKPNALKHFRSDGNLDVVYYSNGQIIESKEYQDFILTSEINRLLELGLDSINLRLRNQFNDFIELDFHIK